MALGLTDSVGAARQLLARVAALSIDTGQRVVAVVVGRAAGGGSRATAHERVALGARRADAFEVALLVDAAGAGRAGTVAALILVAAALIRVARVASVAQTLWWVGRCAASVHTARESLTRTCGDAEKNACQRGSQSLPRVVHETWAFVRYLAQCHSHDSQDTLRDSSTT